ncbi:hypothetical protein COLO4_24191 [Corchorus olitorius]|uniref:Type 2 DNA topoisomerase 6 subunit B-like n=1 Tax=Corchorus olitorius TaxID=93759 RepID=A0A1R3IC84_9ROSI|nr:hypothetical protein COLO4_24191 [Corchorus olitorius]
MNVSSVQKLCIHLISSAFQRCRLSEDLCRLSVVLKSLPATTPMVRVSISDTGIGSCLEEFQDLKYTREGIGTEKWDGLLSVKTTAIILGEGGLAQDVFVGISDNEIYNYHLNLRESVSSRRLTRLPSNPKNVALKYACPFLIPLRPCWQRSTTSFKSSLHFSTSNIERLKSGLEEYVLKHGNTLSHKCDACFSSREQLKIGSGVACSMESHRSSGLTMEAVIAISELSEFPCFWSCSSKTEVLHFKDFSPCPVSQTSLNALTSIDWRSYGLALGSIVDQGKYKTQPDRHLIKKAVKFAFDDLKEKHAGLLLSAHAVKICSYAPDLASTIAGLILTSDDPDFQSECVSILGLQQSEEIGVEMIEDCIKKKIISVIGTNDKKPEKCKEAAAFLFEDDCPQEPYFDEEYEEGEDFLNSPD